jgi:hypothetical protein
MPVETINSVAERYRVLATKLQRQFTSQGQHCPPSFNSPEYLNLSHDIEAARLELREASKRLFEMSSSSEELLIWNQYTKIFGHSGHHLRIALPNRGLRALRQRRDLERRPRAQGRRWH